jgi:hypothetical protein
VNLTTARLEVRERIGELTADFWTDVEVDRAINEGLRQFSSADRWPWLITEGADTIAAGDNELTVPESVDSNSIFNMSLVSDQVSAPRMAERVGAPAGFRLAHVYWTTTGFPRYYYITRTQDAGVTDNIQYIMKFVPTTDVDYEVSYQYFRVPVDLANAGDIPDCPIQYQDAIPAYAAFKLWLKEQAVSQKAQEQYGLYQSILRNAKDDNKAGIDEIVAWGREHPGEGRYWLTERDEVFGRIPPTLG